MIAVKREVAAKPKTNNGLQVFRGANVNLETDDKSLYHKVCVSRNTCVKHKDTHGVVYSHQLVAL